MRKNNRRTKVILTTYAVLFVLLVIFLIIAFKPKPRYYANSCMVLGFSCSNFSISSSELSFDLKNSYEEEITYLMLELLEQEPKGCILQPIKMPWPKDQKRTFLFDCGEKSIDRQPVWLVFNMTYVSDGESQSSQGSVSSVPVENQ